MFRSLSVLVCAVFLASVSSAQHTPDGGRKIPITAPIKHAGTVDVVTGRWTPPGTGPKSLLVDVYNNTCTWTSALYYASYGECEDAYDEGRVPSPSSPSAPAAAVAAQQITTIEIGYCTYNATPIGGMNLELAFWDKLNGNCIGGIPVNHSNLSGGAFWNSLAEFYLDTSGLGLPGSSANNVQSCWIVALDVSGMGWTMASDGEGTFDNDEPNDKFVFGQRINDQSPGGWSSPNGFLLSADPSFAAPGTCTYNIPCATDVFSSLPCGTGLGTWDGVWTNIDSVAVGAASLPPSPCLAATASYGYGTNCYWLGGYPTNPFDSHHLRLTADVNTGPGSFCTSKPSSLPSCTPNLVAPGVTIVKSAPGTVSVTAAPVPGGAGKPGILIYTKAGLLGSPISTAFGFICLNQFQRAGAFPAAPGGTNGVCNGSYTWNLQVIVNAAGSVVPGDVLWIQAWYRDPANPGAANFTNGRGPIPILGASNVSGVSPTAGGEGTVLTILGSSFGTNPIDLAVLLADGVGFADVTSANLTSPSSDPTAASGNALSATVFAVGTTGTGAVTVIHGIGSSLAGQNVVNGGIASNSTLVRQLADGFGTNFGSFNLAPASANTVAANFGLPMPGGISLDLSTLTGDVLEYRLCLKTSTGKLVVCQGRIDFTGIPTATQRALHLADHLNTSFGSLGVSASPSGSSVRVSMAGAAYGGIVVAGK